MVLKLCDTSSGIRSPDQGRERKEPMGDWRYLTIIFEEPGLPWLPTTHSHQMLKPFLSEASAKDEDEAHPAQLTPTLNQRKMRADRLT